MPTPTTSNLEDLLRRVTNGRWEEVLLNAERVRYLTVGGFDNLQLGLTDNARWIVIAGGNASIMDDSIGACEAMVRISRSRLTLLLAEGATRIGLNATVVDQSFPWDVIIQKILLQSSEYWINRALDWITADERNIAIVESLAKSLQQDHISQITAQQIRHKLKGICDQVNVEVEQKLRSARPGSEERKVLLHYVFQRKGHPQREVDLVVMPSRGPNKGKIFAFEFKAYPIPSIQPLIQLRNIITQDAAEVVLSVIWLVSIPAGLRRKLQDDNLAYFEKGVNVEATCKFIDKIVWP